MNRRDTILTFGTAASVALAGCASDSSENTDGGDGNPTADADGSPDGTADGTSDGTQDGTPEGTANDANDGGNTTDPDGEVVDTNTPFEITAYDHELRYQDRERGRTGDFYTVFGTLENTGEQSDNVKIVVDFYDETGARIGGFRIQELSLGPGETWEFDAAYSGDPDEVDHYKLTPGEL